MILLSHIGAVILQNTSKTVVILSFMSSFGKKLRECREEKRLSQAELTRQ